MQPRTRELCDARPIGSRGEQRVTPSLDEGVAAVYTILPGGGNDADDAPASAVKAEPSTTIAATATRIPPDLTSLHSREQPHTEPAQGGMRGEGRDNQLGAGNCMAGRLAERRQSLTRPVDSTA